MRRILAKVGAPVVSQGLTAGTSLLLQVVAARALGIVQYGVFALFLSLLVSATALYTGYIGDSVAVLDRHAARTRSALSASALTALTVFFAAGIGSVLVVRHGDGVSGLVYAGMLVAWLV